MIPHRIRGGALLLFAFGLTVGGSLLGFLGPAVAAVSISLLAAAGLSAVLAAGLLLAWPVFALLRTRWHRLAAALFAGIVGLTIVTLAAVTIFQPMSYPAESMQVPAP
jgi:hypothetical protein